MKSFWEPRGQFIHFFEVFSVELQSSEALTSSARKVSPLILEKEFLEQTFLRNFKKFVDNSLEEWNHFESQEGNLSTFFWSFSVELQSSEALTSSARKVSPLILEKEFLEQTFLRNFKNLWIILEEWNHFESQEGNLSTFFFWSFQRRASEFWSSNLQCKKSFSFNSRKRIFRANFS